MSSQRVIKLSDSETFRFLDLYRNESLLYDTTTLEYRDRDLRAAAAKRISDAMKVPGFGPSEVIMKFKNLRNSYCQELKKIAASKKSGKSADEVYKPKVVWFLKMNSFIYPHVQQRQTKANLDSSLMSQSSSQEDADGEHDIWSPSITLVTGEFTEGKRPADKLPTSASQPKRLLVSSSSSGDQTKRLGISVNSVDDFASPCQSSDNAEDQYDTFARHIAAQLRALPERNFIVLQGKIQALVSAERLSCLSANDGSSS